MNYYDNYGSYYTSTDTSSGALAGVMAVLGTYSIVMCAVGLLMLVAMWKLFKKAGKNGWEALIPIYNMIVLLQIVELPVWYILLYFVPFANIYVMFKQYIELAHKFGKTTGFGVLTAFFPYICLPILAFGNNNYQGNMNYNQPMNNGMNQNNYNQPMNNEMNQNNYNQPMNNGMNQNNYNQHMNNGMNQPVMDNSNNQSIQDFTQNAQPISNQTSKYCSNCGAKVDITANNCPMCGTKLQ